MPLKDLNIENQVYIKQELLNDDSWMSYQTGDIIKRADLNIIIHSTNCFHTMNSGVAYKISQNYLETVIADKKTPCGNPEKLGTFSAAMEKNINSKNPLLIVNLYGQFHPGVCSDNSESLDSKENRFLQLKESLIKFAEFIKIFNMEISETNKCKFYVGVPWLIGCGSSGGDYNQIFLLFKEIFSSMSNEIKIIFVDNNDEY